MPPARAAKSEVDARELRNPYDGLGRVEGGESAVDAADPLAGLRARGLVQEPERPKRARSGSHRIEASGSVSELVAEQRR